MKLNNKAFDITKHIAQIYLPAAGTLYFALAGIWHLPSAEEVVGSVVAVDAFLGVLLGLSTASYNKSDDKYDGVFQVEDSGEDGSALRLKSVDFHALDTKDELIFKLKR